MPHIIRYRSSRCAMSKTNRFSSDPEVVRTVLFRPPFISSSEVASLLFLHLSKDICTSSRGSCRE